MKHNIILGAGLSALAILPGCTSDFDPQLDDKPIAVLNMLAEPDSLLSVSVTHTWPSVGPKPDVTVRDAIVLYSVNGEERRTMHFDTSTCRYITDYRVREGDAISISAYSEEYGDAAGATIVPVAVPIDNWNYTVDAYVDYNTTVVYPGGPSYHPKRVDITYHITFTDPAGEENFYMLSDGAYCDDPILGENDTPLDAIFSKYHDYAVFSDRSIEGRSYTLTCVNSYVSYQMHDDLVAKIKLYTISRDCYLYLLSLYKKYEGFNGALDDFGMADPKAVYTNVTPGIGIVAARSPELIIHDVTDIVTEHLSTQ